MQNITKHLSPHLFWDTKLESLDLQKNKRLIIERVLHRGTLEEWNFIKNYYGRDELIKVICELPFIAPKEANFVKVLFNLEPQQMRCYTKIRLNHFY